MVTTENYRRDPDSDRDGYWRYLDGDRGFHTGETPGATGDILMAIEDSTQARRLWLL